MSRTKFVQRFGGSRLTKPARQVIAAARAETALLLHPLRLFASSLKPFFAEVLGELQAHHQLADLRAGRDQPPLLRLSLGAQPPLTLLQEDPSPARGGAEAIAAVLTADLSSLLYARYLGGSGEDFGRATTVDSTGVFVIAGETNSSDWPLVHARQRRYAGGNADTILVKFALPDALFVSDSSRR